MPTISHYEVYTLEDTGWVLHAQYLNSEKERALEEARALETYLGRPTKVMRESYDSENNRYGEQTIFLSPRALDMRRRERERREREGLPFNEAEWNRAPFAGGATTAGFRPGAKMPAGLNQFGGPSQTGAAGSGNRTRFGAPTHARSTSDLLARVLFVMVVSLIIGTAGAALLPVIINLMRGFNVYIDSQSLPASSFSIFMVLFVGTAFWLTLRMVPLQGILETGRSRSKPLRRSPSDTDSDTTGSSKASSDTNREDKDAADQAAAEEAKKRKADQEAEREREKRKREEQKEIEKERKAEEIKKEEEKEKERKKSEKEKENKKKKEEQEKRAAELEASPPEAPPGPNFPSAHATTMSFLNTYVVALKELRPKLDPYNRFGINLYLAGVCETMSLQASLSEGEFHRLLRETVEIMGTRTAQAQSFIKQLPSYLAEDRYAQMIQCGREAMTLHLSGASNAFDNLGMVMEDWNTPKTQTITGSTIAIVFTDMVGSTDLTSEHGDVKAQLILRAHNAAVRSALGRFSGREIKHTGDGIMATFEHVPDAVWGMIDVLKAVQAHNQVEPEIPLRIRIGINAGEPVSAENDYYGLAVNIAARICAKANMDEIMVSQIVHDMCDGTKLTFKERETVLLKGVKDPQRLYEAIWEGSPSQRYHTAADGASAPDETTLATPSQPGAGEVHRADATVDLEADGWIDPSVDDNSGEDTEDTDHPTTWDTRVESRLTHAATRSPSGPPPSSQTPPGTSRH